MRFVLVALLCCWLAGCAARSIPPKVVVVPEAGQASGTPDTPRSGSKIGVSTLYFVREEQLWRFDVADGKATPMGVGTTCPGSGEIEVGSDRPLLSPGGRFIAHLSSHKVVLTDVKTAKSRPVTYPGEPGPNSNLEVLLSGWSPDGRYFIFHVGRGGAELGGREDAPDTEGREAPGFVLLDSTDFSVRLLTGLKSFVAWAPDSRRVVVEATSSNGNRGLFFVDLDGGHRTLLREAVPGFHQLSISGEQAAWMDGMHVAVATLGSGEPVWMTPDGEFATFQRPSLSPDGKHLAYVHRLRRVQGRPVLELLVVNRAGANPHSLRECRDSCTYQWSGAARLALEQPEGIFYLDLEGNAVAVSGPDSTLVFVGQE